MECHLLDDKNFQDGINFIANLIQQHHNEQFNWTKKIYDNQQNIKKVVGIDDGSLPFEPYYNRGIDLSSNEPEIYNKYGERLRVCFVSDRESPNASGGGGRYMYWDRYNYGLKNHFYSHDEAFRTVGNPNKRFAYLIEPPSIKPQSYENYLKNKEYMEKNFDLIFTFDVNILSNLKNARWAPLESVGKLILT